MKELETNAIQAQIYNYSSMKQDNIVIELDVSFAIPHTYAVAWLTYNGSVHKKKGESHGKKNVE